MHTMAQRLFIPESNEIFAKRDTWKAPEHCGNKDGEKER